ncbi:MAG: conserved membrane protein of unknown function [Promethearchaeota archaeon]|nr:MAG: conserved membrane protein of unknown function [Candidatus Lokiarchaeota archaeon]
MALTELDILNGVFNLVFVITSIILGLIILLKYFKNKNVNFIYMGLTLIFLSSGWYGTSVSFLIALISGNEGLTFQQIALLNFVPLPFGLLSWITVFTNLLYKNKQTLIILFTLILTGFFYVFFFIALFTNPLTVGEKITPVDTKGNSLFLLSYVFIFIIIVVLTGVKFGYETMNYDNPEMKLKGRILIIAFPTYAIAGFLDSTIPSTAITLIIFRVILILSAFGFYGGFILPKWLKKILIKPPENENSQIGSRESDN